MIRFKPFTHFNVHANCLVRTALDEQVFVRWFFVSNWSTINIVKKSELYEWLFRQLDWYDEEFTRRTKFEVIDNGTLYELTGEHVAQLLKDAEEGGNDNH